MSGARVEIESTMSWTADGPGSALLIVRVAEAADQLLIDEDVSADGARIEYGPADALGTRLMRLHTDGGAVRVRYRASVEVDGDAREALHGDVALPDGADLAFDLLPWLLPSRYATSDALAPTAASTFGEVPRTRALIPWSATGSATGWRTRRVPATR